MCDPSNSPESKVISEILGKVPKVTHNRQKRGGKFIYGVPKGKEKLCEEDI
jgi:hypothetical protein